MRILVVSIKELLVTVLVLKLLKLLVELLHPSAELNSSLPRSLHVELSGLRVVLHHLQELVLLETQSDAELVQVAITGLVGDL